MMQGAPPLFSSGFEMACLVASSGLLSFLWNLIADINGEAHPNENLFWKKLSNGSDSTIIVFGTSEMLVQPGFLSSADMMDGLFEFLCSKNTPHFSLNQSAVSLFDDHRQKLGQLKSEIDLKTPVIVTGHGVGGSIASLFTLLLIEKMGLSDKCPLCITFGSPLIGDRDLQEAISRSSKWHSCFLHVASPRDQFISSSISNDSYRPFGTFLLCSDAGSTCSEDPDSILKLLKEMSTLSQGSQIQGYGNIVDNLTRKAICKGSDVPSTPQNLLQLSLALQLHELGFPNSQPTQNNLVKDLERQLTPKKRKRLINHRNLDEMKKNMAQLEWYKKTSKDSEIGYYDRYKNFLYRSDQDVVRLIKELNNYWQEMVEEVDKQPQKEGKAFRTRWLYAGTNCRRMVEPLNIAQYYRERGEDYINNGRSEHFKQLEKWLEEDRKPEAINRKNVESILTLDSCFWAHVEEARISLRKCGAPGSSVEEKQEAMRRLEEFEEYVYGLLKNYTVSPEIFLKDSSYMSWWNDYIRFRGPAHGSRLANFMKNYAKYGNGEYDFTRE